MGLRAISRGFLTCRRAYFYMSDNANLLDIAESCKVGRLSCNVLELSAVMR
jgi:hypothetical protein